MMGTLTLFIGWSLAVFIGSLEILILWMIGSGKINLSKLISETNGDASLSRFQFLIFTFIISMSFILVVLGHEGGPQFPQEIPAGVLALMGVSGGSYVISKGIHLSGQNKAKTPPT